MNNIEKSIIAASLIGTIFSQYEAGELNRAGEEVKKRIGKYMRKRAKSNRNEFGNAILNTDKAWQDAINHFVNDNVRIEAKSTIRAVYNYFSNELTKYANVSDKHIERMMINTTSDAEAEHNSDTVVDYIVEQLGFPKRKNAFHARLAILKGNRILEGKEA